MGYTEQVLSLWRLFAMLRAAVRLVAFVVLFTHFAAVHAAPADPPIDEDEQLLKQRSIGVDGPALLEYFRSRTPSEARRQQAAALIQKLGDDNYTVREEATTALIRLGTPALAELKKVEKHPDLEVRRRVQRCLSSIQGADPASVAAAAARLLRTRKPADATITLIDFLPHVNNADAEEDILVTLVLLAGHAGTADAGLQPLLRDAEPLKRAAAALVLARHGTAEQKKAAQERLGDSDARVRFRAAQGTLACRDKTAVPILIALLEEIDGEIGPKAEDLLFRAAGEKWPAAGLGMGALPRKQVREVWAGWWKAEGSRLDLAKADVDINSVNPGLQAKRVSEQFLNAYLKSDKEGLRRTVNVPFIMNSSDKNLENRDDVVSFFEQVGKPARIQNITFTVGTTLAIQSYFKNGGAIGGGGGGEAAKKRELLRKPGTLAVVIKVNDNGRKEEVALFVRLIGGRAYVIGVGERQANE
jgi:hypothetical protein